ncbi:hypothetical protein [Mesorhizobium sp. WSM2239]|uniref:Uncharacterized protein n=2 Tax=unclassified Mesorhizobium TaxID=325217 RepID=A0AAU8DFV9_9HYPH
MFEPLGERADDVHETAACAAAEDAGASRETGLADFRQAKKPCVIQDLRVISTIMTASTITPISTMLAEVSTYGV